MSHKFNGVDLRSGHLPYPIPLHEIEVLAFVRLLQEWDAVDGRTVKIPLDSGTVMLPKARWHRPKN